jgi:fatty acid desaturase
MPPSLAPTPHAKTPPIGPPSFALESLSEPKTRDTSAADMANSAAFRDAMDALRKETEASLTHEDYAHWNKMRHWGQACTAFGYATAWIFPNPLSATAIALGASAKWTIVAHHASHKGLDAVPGTPARHTSRHFAKGARRFIDWLDWIAPDAWHTEHNVLHHYHTGEVTDPDLVEENARWMRETNLPRPLKYAVVGFYALTWKYTYYAPSTFQVLRRAEKRRHARRHGLETEPEAVASQEASYISVFNPRTREGRAFWKKCLLPYGLTRFAAVPLAYAPLGPWAVFSVWANSVMAECITNVHTFMIIAPNHAGSDLYRFDEPKHRYADFYARQVMGSVNYETGGDVRDFLQGFLNYQIEHHLFPALPPRAYQRIQPRVKELCAKHGIPYVQEPVLKRVRKLIDIMVGKTSMKRG